MVGLLRSPAVQPWNSNRSHGFPAIPPPPALRARSALSKQGHRLFTSISTAGGGENSPAADRLIRKFVASSSKSVSLNAISHLLSPATADLHPRLSSLAIPLYASIAKAPWFRWNPKMMADLIALLHQQERVEEAETFLSESISRLRNKERDLCSFYCHLIDSHSKHGSKQRVYNSYEDLKWLCSESSSIYTRKRAYEAMIGGLCALDLPFEAETLMEEMRNAGINPSVFEYRSLIFGYGRLGYFDDMRRQVGLMEEDGYGLDVITSNMVISSFGAHSELSELVLWIKRMKQLGIPFSIRTYNSALNSCPTIMSMVQNPKTIPTTIAGLMESLEDGDEAMLVRELTRSSILEGVTNWDESKLKLDLHGMHLGTAYLIILQLLQSLRWGVVNGGGEERFPSEIVVVCGVGKHSSVRGESPVKGLVKGMMLQLNCPMRIDRKNGGCFIAKGKVFRDLWS